MKSYLFTLIFCAFNVFSFAQDFPNFISNSEVTVITYWEVGDKAVYHCEKESKRFKNGKEQTRKSSVSEYDLTLDVLEQTDSSYLVEMSYSSFSGQDDFDVMMTDVIRDLSIKYVTDEMGGFDSIVNTDELIEYSLEKIDLIMSQLDSTDSSVFQVLENMINTFSSPENIEALFVEDIINIHGLYGLGLVLDEEVVYELEYPTLEGLTLNGLGANTLKSIDKSHDKCMITEVQKPFDEELDSYLSEIFTLIYPDEEFSLNEVDFKFKSNAKMNYTMELSTGWMTKVKVKTTVSVKVDGVTGKNVETITYVRD